MAKGKKEDGTPSWRGRKGGSGGNTPPRPGMSTASGKKCENDHPANSEGLCFEGSCEYYVRKGL